MSQPSEQQYPLRPKDRDLILTREGLYFTVVGYQHPPDRIFAYLKYVPAPGGKWKNESHQLERVLPHYSASMVLNTFQFLEKKHPEYLYDCPVNNIRMSAVPQSDIKKYYMPQKAVSNLKSRSNLDQLQKKAMDLIKFMANASNIPLEYFGLTGSLLLNIHDPLFSDIDVTIHGHENSKIIQKMIINLYENDDRFAKLSAQEASEWKSRKMKQFNLTSESARILFDRKWNMGYFSGTRFSIHPIHLDDEVTPPYGSKRYLPVGEGTIQARIIKDAESFYIPCIYEIGDVVVTEGPPLKDIREIVSFEGLYCSIGRKGEQIKCKGKLERVSDNQNGNYHRIVLGSFLNSTDFFIPLV